MALLEYKHADISYGDLTIVKDFNLSVKAGEIVSIVGESGSGKTTVIRSALGLLSGGRVSAGDVLFEDKSILSYTKKEWNRLRGHSISMIFQDSGAMMNPTRTIGACFIEYIRSQIKNSKKEAWDMACHMLERMRLPSADNVMRSYPFQLSGGMLQRVGIAMAMTFQPKLLLADEPTSALDVTTQAQIVRQMMELRDEFGTSIIMVTHNLGVAAYMGDRILVMQKGEVVESGDREKILNHAEHAYTQSLIQAVPTLEGYRYV